MNRILLIVGLLTASATSAMELAVDFAKDSGRVRPELHSSGWAPRSCPRRFSNDDAVIKSMNMCYTRTHDWALVNGGQRVCDYQYIFPLIDKDTSDPSNYYFEPTDHLLSLSRDLGLKLIYRLGSSIEHTGDVHFNTKVPKDYDKVAEIFAATIRHYNKGWANGHHWGILYWEIWNEPDGIKSSWCLPEAEGGTDFCAMRDKFIPFYVTVLKRLKREFPEVKVGGPALTWLNEDYFTRLLKACKAAGVAPDFISWHSYSSDPVALAATPAKARKLCDDLGFTKTELIIDEYHYLLSSEGIFTANPSPAVLKLALDGPTGLNNIDAACFYLTALSLFQTSPVDQAYWYGCAHSGNWGYMDQYRLFNKPYYAATLFGGIVKDFPKLGEVKNSGTVTTFVAKSADGNRAALLVTDYRGSDRQLKIKTGGLADVKHVSAVLLDDRHDNEPIEVTWRNNTLTLVKPDHNSAAFLVTFER